MLDNLRESASQSPFFQEEQAPPEKPPSRLRRRRSYGPFLGMTPLQRFVVALMLFLMTCMLGTLCLLVTEKIVIRLF
jgi:hypothetical protein